MAFLLPDLTGAIGALVLLLIAAGLWLLASLLANTLGNAPVIGGWVKRDLAGWLRDAGNTVLRASKATWHFATGIFNWAQDILTKPLIYAYDYAASAWKWINTLFTQTIPDAENRALNYALGLAQSVRADFDHEIAAVSSDLRYDYDTLAQRVAAVERAAFGEAAAAETKAVQYAHSLVAGTITDLDTTADHVISTVWPDADGDIAALRKAIGAGFPDVNDLLGGLAGLGTAGLLGLMIRAISGTAAVTELAVDCTIPNCRNLSQLGQDLQELLGAASTAAMIAWLIFAVTDPQGAATDIQTVALDPLRMVVGNASRLFGGPG